MKIKAKSLPEHLDNRIISKFLFFPKTLNLQCSKERETRWLVRSQWRELYWVSSRTGAPSMWLEQYWVD